MRKVLLALLLLVGGTAHASKPVAIDGDITVRSSAILTTSFVGSTALEMPFSDQANCLVSVTIGSLTSAEVKAQFSQNNTDWYDETERQATTVTAATGIDLAIGVVYPKVYQWNDSGDLMISTPVMARYFRLAVKGTGTTTNSLAAIRCVYGAL